MTIRFKLTMGAIAAILVANALFSLVNVVYLERTWLAEVQNRVRLDLNSARTTYNNHIERISAYLTAAALDDARTGAFEAPRGDELSAWLNKLRKSAAIDVLTLTDSRGSVLYRAHNPARRGDSLADNPLFARVLKSGEACFGTVIVSPAAMRNEGPELAARATFELLPTPAARPTQEQRRADGMLVGAAVPILDKEGKIAGILYGGDLLDRRHELVDEIKREVFPAENYEGKDVGTVTIFQGDLRIATNVIHDDGARAVGTRMSAAVAEEVLERGGTWSKPAFVVNDWYITAYEPIRDPSRRIIGAIYVGLLRAPFAQNQAALIIRFLVTMIAATAASLALIFLVTMVVMRPISKIVEMSRKIIDGDISARVGIRPAGELGVLCQAVDCMADAVAERETRLKQSVHQQVAQAEKLASIGRLAAGVAHEINNPLTGVLTFSHLMREKPNMDDQDREDLDLIIRETTRAADIVRGLLDFARERPVLMEELDLNEVVFRTVRLIANQKKFEHIVIEQLLQEDLPTVRGDMNQLQQVLLNLSLNACTAMPNGGKLTIRTAVVGDHVLLRVSDTGHGIKKEHLDRIFEPFFTTQDVGKGTGLGLSVTHGIIEKHGGQMEVQSEEGRGSAFTISLPALP